MILEVREMIGNYGICEDTGKVYHQYGELQPRKSGDYRLKHEGKCREVGSDLILIYAKQQPTMWSRFPEIQIIDESGFDLVVDLDGYEVTLPADVYFMLQQTFVYGKPQLKHKKHTSYVRVPELDTGATIALHRVIMDAPDGMVVHHEDYNGLNNSRDNLAVVTQKYNCRARQATKGYWEIEPGMYRPHVVADYKLYVGPVQFTVEEAQDVRDQMAQRLHGDAYRPAKR